MLIMINIVKGNIGFNSRRVDSIEGVNNYLIVINVLKGFLYTSVTFLINMILE